MLCTTTLANIAYIEFLNYIWLMHDHYFLAENGDDANPSLYLLCMVNTKNFNAWSNKSWHTSTSRNTVCIHVACFASCFSNVCTTHTCTAFRHACTYIQ